mmetsp:Transcript_49930/g.93452  ORF Transcript_49930/g.93452 Transcript_49930/m.93452 type:complete len:93 (+) Transcript_49930:68-346(+)
MFFRLVQQLLLTAALVRALSGQQQTDDVALLQRTGAPVLKELSVEELLEEDEDAEDVEDLMEPLDEIVQPAKEPPSYVGISPCVAAGTCPEA